MNNTLEENIKENIQIEQNVPVPAVEVKKQKVTLPDVVVPKRYHPALITFRVSPEHVSRVEFTDTEDKRKKPIVIHHVFPKLSEYQAGLLPDDVNPRSHLLETLKSSRIAKEIENTIREKPSLFHFYNRGSMILCDSFYYDEKNHLATIKITNSDQHGLVGGGSSDRVIAKVQRTLLGNKNIHDIPKEEVPELLKRARVHLEIMENFDDKDRIVDFSEARNSSIKVKMFSLADLRGDFEWIKDILEKENSKFKGKVGYDENSLEETSILEVIALTTLFHNEFNELDDEGKMKAPTVAYTSKGKLDGRLADESLSPGYKALAPILEDILTLHDYVYSTFDQKYQESVKKAARLGRRPGFESLDDPYVLPLTESKTNYLISNGILYPVLNAFRALIQYNKETGLAKWKTSPFSFWDQYGTTLVRVIIDHLQSAKTVNALGKDRLAYINLYREAKLLLYGEQ